MIHQDRSTPAEFSPRQAFLVLFSQPLMPFAEETFNVFQAIQVLMLCPHILMERCKALNLEQKI
jgi:hypothetical protein